MFSAHSDELAVYRYIGYFVNEISVSTHISVERRLYGSVGEFYGKGAGTDS